MSEAAGRLWTRTGARIKLNQHEGQSAAWQSEARFIFVLAGTQGGKTSWGPWWLLREAQRRGSGDYLAVTATYDLFKLKMLPALREVFEEATGWGRYWAAGRVIELADPATLRFSAKRADDRMWGRILLRSASSGGGLEAATALGAWLDECGQDAFGVETWEATLRRLSLACGRALGTTTPYGPGWLKREVEDRWAAGDDNYAVIRFPSMANPSFPAEEFERARRTMPAWRFRMFYCGEFTRPAGLVYGAFSDERNVCDELAPPSEWPRWVGVDFGAVNTAVVWLAREPGTGTAVVYRESLRGGWTTAQHARAALAEADSGAVAGWLGGAPGEEQQRRDWRQSGVAVQRPPVADLEAGIDRVAQLFESGGLRVARGCRGLLDEIATYRRRCDASGAPTLEIENRSAFHRLDALRYAVSGMGAGRPGVVRGFWR